MRVELVERPGEEWDRFAEAHPEGRLGHASAWSAIFKAAYGLEPHYLCARSREGEIRGVLPLVGFRSRPGGPSRLISLPFLDSAGILTAQPEAEVALWTHALAMAAEHAFASLELRTTVIPGSSSGSAPTMDRVNLELELQPNEETQWKSLSAKVRNQCRKAEREGLELAAGDRGRLREAFLLPYHINMRDLGSPPHSRKFFDSLSDCFGERMRFIATVHGDRSVGGLVAIRFGRRVYVPWASTLRSERNRCPNNRIYWEAIRWAIDSGASWLDFGRSPRDGGTYRFKKGWGAVEEELCWREFDQQGVGTPRGAATESTVVRGLSRIWTRLPVAVATALGARIRRYFAN